MSYIFPHKTISQVCLKKPIANPDKLILFYLPCLFERIDNLVCPKFLIITERKTISHTSRETLKRLLNAFYIKKLFL